MGKVTSNHKGRLGLPGGITLRPGVPTNVDRWDIIKNHAVVRSWISAGVLEADDEADRSGQPAKTPADILAMASNPDVPFMSFKAAAAKLLGEKTPSKKDEIVAALEDLTPQP